MSHDPSAIEVLATTIIHPGWSECATLGTTLSGQLLDALTAAGLAVVRVGEVERLRSVIDRCPFDDTPLQHDDENPQLCWWCGTCGHITDRPSALALTPEATDD